VQIQHDPVDKLSEIFLLQGKVTMRQVDEGRFRLTNFFDDNQGARQGLIFWRDLPETHIMVNIQEPTTINLSSATTLEFMGSVLSLSPGMQVINLAESPLVLLFPKTQEEIVLAEKHDLTIIAPSPEEVFEIKALESLNVTFRLLSSEAPFIPPEQSTPLPAPPDNIIPKPRPTEPSGSPILP
jgi:hypothetical protein